MRTKRFEINNSHQIKKNFLIFLFVFYTSFCFIVYNKSKNYQQDELTLVSAYYRIKSKHTPEQYLRWINNIVLLNKSIVLFTNKEFMPILKDLRPKELYNKTVFIEFEIEEFYSFKKFYKDFNQSFELDYENSYHTVPLYLIWAEKCMFLKRAILHNYFNSKCFYWIDIGYFREDKKDMEKYINTWPSTKKCYSNNKLLMGQIKNFSQTEKEKIVSFDIDTHIKLNRNLNVAGNIFGGQIKNSLKFIYFYYEAIKLFIKKKIFIGRDQTIFTYVAFAHPEIMNLIMVKNFREFRKVLA